MGAVDGAGGGVGDQTLETVQLEEITIGRSDYKEEEEEHITEAGRTEEGS